MSWYLMGQAHETCLSQVDMPYTCKTHLLVKDWFHARERFFHIKYVFFCFVLSLLIGNYF